MKQKRNIQPRIGIDIGRVIMTPVVGGKADTAFLFGDMDRAMQTPPSQGVFDGVRQLVDAYDGAAWLISKCGPNVQQKTKRWLRHWDFYGATGLPQKNLRFCLKRPEKANHCRQLKITHFIDDRLDVLTHLRDDVPFLYLFGEQPDLNEIPDWVVHVPDWSYATEAALQGLQLHRS